MSSPVRIQNMPHAPHLNQAFDATSAAKVMPNPINHQSSPPANNLSSKRVTHENIANECIYSITDNRLTTSHKQNVDLKPSVKRQLCAEILQTKEAIGLDKDNMDLRFRIVKIALQIAGSMQTEEKIKGYLLHTHQTVTIMRKSKYFDHQTHYAEHLLNTYEGIDCTVTGADGKIHPDLSHARQVILPLKRALELDPSSQTYKTALTHLTAAFTAIFAKLKQEHKISKDEYNSALAELNQILTEDPFKDEFINDPSLFKRLKNAPTTLLERFPHLKDPDAFLMKYPSVATINWSNDSNIETIKDIVNNISKNPLQIVFPFINRNHPILSPAIADIFEKAMLKNPRLRIALSWKEDVETLSDAFMRDDSVLSYNLVGSEYQDDGYNLRVVVLNPNNLPKMKK